MKTDKKRREFKDSITIHYSMSYFMVHMSDTSLKHITVVRTMEQNTIVLCVKSKNGRIREEERQSSTIRVCFLLIEIVHFGAYHEENEQKKTNGVTNSRFLYSFPK